MNVEMFITLWGLTLYAAVRLGNHITHKKLENIEKMVKQLKGEGMNEGKNIE